jgi:hypothetical protein
MKIQNVTKLVTFFFYRLDEFPAIGKGAHWGYSAKDFK